MWLVRCRFDLLSLRGGGGAKCLLFEERVKGGESVKSMTSVVLVAAGMFTCNLNVVLK